MELLINRGEPASNALRAIGQPSPSRRRNTALALRRRHNRLMREFAGDLGNVKLTRAECELLKQAATLVLAAEQRQGALVRGEAVDSGELVKLSSEARRVLSTLHKHAAPVRRDQLAEIAAESAADVPEGDEAA